MRAYSGNVADWIKEFYTQTRGLLNDSKGQVATDEALAPFIHEALNRVPILAASFFAISRGATEAAEEMLCWPTIKFEEEKCSEPQKS